MGLEMGIAWGGLPIEMRTKWREYDCNNVTPWERSKENRQKWCDAVRIKLRGSRTSHAVQRKAKLYNCYFEEDTKPSLPLSYVRSSGNQERDCLRVHGVHNCGRFVSVHWHGRFGNRVFQYAFLCEAARRYAPSIVYLTSNWEGTILFDIEQCPVLILPEELSNPFNEIFSSVKGSKKEKNERVGGLFDEYSKLNPFFGESPKAWQFLERTEPSRNKLGNVNVWINSLRMMYSGSIFEKMDRGHLMRLLSWSDHVRSSKIFKILKAEARTYDVAQLRRDDVLNVQRHDGTCKDYCVISIQSYKNAMKDRGIDVDSVIWVSDDSKISTKQPWHDEMNRVIRSLPQKHWQYPTGEPYVPDYMFHFFPDLLLMSLSRRFFRAPSSFGFWGGFLSQINSCSYVYSVDMHHCERGDLVKRIPTRKSDKKAYEYHCPFTASNSNHFVLAGRENEPFDDITWG